MNNIPLLTIETFEDSVSRVLGKMKTYPYLFIFQGRKFIKLFNKLIIKDLINSQIKGDKKE